MSHRLWAKLALPLAALSLAAGVVPAAAQSFSDGYQLLKAVRDSDGGKAIDLLSKPGSTLVNTRDESNGETALHIATRRRDPVWIRFLIQRGANPNIADDKGTTPLIIAASQGDADSAEALLNGGARVNDSDAVGETPLILATHLNDTALVKALLDHGADPDRSDNSGRTARDYAKRDDDRRLLDAFDAHDTAAAKAQSTYGPHP